MSTLVLPDVSASQLSRYAALIYEKIGVTISPQKATLLSNRLRRRLRATGIEDYDAYYSMLVSASVTDSEWQSFLQEITTHETYLYRDESHWKWFREEFLRKAAQDAAKNVRPKSLRIWSAACSTGDEAATIACCIAEGLPSAAEWKIEILGTDIGAGAVAQASKATFNTRSMRNVAPLLRKKHFVPVPNDEFALAPKLRSYLRFKTHNLLKPLGERAFDVIFLKNVLIYFDKASKKRVVESVRGVLQKGGYLITGPAEGVSDLLHDFDSAQAWLHCYAPAARR